MIFNGVVVSGPLVYCIACLIYKHPMRILTKSKYFIGFCILLLRNFKMLFVVIRGRFNIYHCDRITSARRWEKIK